MAEAFPGHRAYAAWLSGKVVERVRKERGEAHLTLEEALGQIAADGVDELVVAPTCLMEGFEMKRLRQALAQWARPGMTVRLGTPLLATPEDRRDLALILSGEFGYVPDSEAMLFMGHGSRKGDNDVYLRISDEFASLGLAHFLVATLEGEPSFDEALAVLRERRPSRVHVTPLMIVAGEHATKDMAGPEAESWTSRLAACGFEVDPIVRGLGEYPAVRELVAKHAHAALPILPAKE